MPAQANRRGFGPAGGVFGGLSDWGGAFGRGGAAFEGGEYEEVPGVGGDGGAANMMVIYTTTVNHGYKQPDF